MGLGLTLIWANRLSQSSRRSKIGVNVIKVNEISERFMSGEGNVRGYSFNILSLRLSGEI